MLRRAFYHHGMSSWLRDGELLLHIGIHKTGTTAIQGSLAQARPSLAEQGVAYPGKNPSQFRAAMSIVHPAEVDTDDAVAIPLERWERLRRQVGKSAAAKVVVSSEVFCEADDATAARVVAELSDRPSERSGRFAPRVLIGVRPLWQLLPSTWQQYVKSGLTQPYDSWLDAVFNDPSASGTPTFWMRNDLPALIRRWGALVGPSNVGVYLVDSTNRDAAYSLFETVIGLSPGTLTQNPDHPANPSLTAEQTEVIRRVNLQLAHRVDYRTYRREIRRGAVLELLANPTGHPVHTPTWALARAQERSSADLVELRSSGVHELNELSGLAASPPSLMHTPPEFDDAQIDAEAERIAHHVLEATR